MEKIEEVKVTFTAEAHSALAELAATNSITIERQAERIVIESLLRRGLIEESIQEEIKFTPGFMADDSRVNFKVKK